MRGELELDVLCFNGPSRRCGLVGDGLAVHGDLLYKKYNKHPEIWRHAGDTAGESSAIVWSAPLPFLTCAIFAAACEWLHLSFHETIGLAVAVWLIAPLPWIITISLFMKLQAMIAASYSIGWLVKLVIAAAAVCLILR